MVLLGLITYKYKGKITEKLDKLKFSAKVLYIYSLYILLIGVLVFDIAVPKVDAQVIELSKKDAFLNATAAEKMFGRNFNKNSKSFKNKFFSTPKVKSAGYVLCSAYNSVPGQTDSTPCITADGYNVCKANKENVIAANFLPFGTKVRFSDYFGDRVFEVHDRMNKRYTYKVDFWMTGDTYQDAYQKARNFGVRKLRMEILD